MADGIWADLLGVVWFDVGFSLHRDENGPRSIFEVLGNTILFLDGSYIWHYVACRQKASGATAV